MLNSQSKQLMGPKRVLETVCIAAYFPKRLNKNLIQMANIPSSVDKILQDQVPTVRYGVLAFLLLGIVRIYSKKVEYLCEECDHVLVQLNEFSIKKKTNTIDEANCASSPSITRPNSFQLDAFDLQISEERLCSHVRQSEDLMLEGTRKDAWDSYHSVDKNYSPFDGFNSGAFSAAFTPFSDVLSLHFKENEIISSSTCTFSTIEKLRENNSFFLDETLDPIILGEVDKEQTGVPNVYKYIEVEEGPSSAAAFDDNHEMDGTMEKLMSPESLIDRQDSTLIDVTPMFKDPEDPILSSNGEFVEKYTPTDGEGPSSVADTDIVRKLNFPVIVTPECINDRPASLNVDQTPIFKGTNASGSPRKSLPIKRTADGEHIINNSLGRQQMTPNTNIAQNALLFAKTPEVQQQASGRASNKKMVQSTSVTTGNLTPKFMAVQTPAAMESGTFSKRRKCLMDDNRVLDSSVIKENLANPSDLIRLRTEVPHAPLHVWKIQKISNLPGSLFEPLIPYSSALGSVFSVENIKKVQVLGATETQQGLNILGSPVIHQSPDREVNRLESPSIHQSPARELNILEFPIIHQSPEQQVVLLEAPSNHRTPDIAPSTPVAFTSSSKFHYGPSVSQEEERYENAEFDNEDINSSAGDSWEMNKWSVKTRAAARCLCNIFISRRKQKEHEEAKLSEMLKGKRKGDSATLFYELLVLKSGGYVDVKQHAPFDDITIVGTCKLKNFSGF